MPLIVCIEIGCKRHSEVAVYMGLKCRSLREARATDDDAVAAAATDAESSARRAMQNGGSSRKNRKGSRKHRNLCQR